MMRISVRNTYYNASGDICPDFSVHPTSSTASLMTTLGLLLKIDPDGFSVLLDSKREEAFLDYLRGQAKLSRSPDSATPGLWTRLSFALTLVNPNFFNFTDLPIDLAPATRTFYLSNTRARSTGEGTAELNPSPLNSVAPVPLTGSQYRVAVDDPGAARVIVTGLSGREAICQPVFWPRHEVKPPQCYTDGTSVGSQDLVRRNPIFLDFSPLPEAWYRVAECANPSGDCATISSEDVVYSAASSPPLFFIDLLFTDPHADSAPAFGAGVYPVTNLLNPKQAAVAPVHYFLNLQNRSTIWNYYIVSRGSILRDLRINMTAPRRSPEVTFTGPTAVKLPGNQRASLFVSDTAIPLQEQSAYKFQLLGRAGDIEPKNGVLMNRLPVASSQQVIPAVGNFATSGPDESSGVPADAQPGKMFSDIYVYV